MAQKTERDFSTKKRAGMDLADFGDPDKRAFPVVTQDDLDNDARLIGHADNPAAVKKRLIAIAKRRGLSLPDAWKEESEEEGSNKKESVPTAGSSSSFRPKSKIATLTACFVEDGAISLNGRQYPREAVDALIQSGQVALSDPNALPLVSYTSHDAADRDDPFYMSGKLTRIWREGNKGMFAMDVPDTTAGRDMVALYAGNYLKTMSLRAGGAELRLAPGQSYPQVGGASLHLQGVDFAPTPGLPQAAKIQGVVLESQAPADIIDTFTLHAQDLLLESYEDTSMTKKLNEATPPGGNMAGGYQPTSGEAPFMTSDNPDDSYHQRMYKQPDMTSGPMQGMDSTGKAVDVQEAHDRIAMVQNRACAPGRESARWKTAYAGLSLTEQATVALGEAGRALSAKNDSHLDAAHHATARHLGMDCEGKNNKMGSVQPADDGMQDGDDDDNPNESARPRRARKENPMTPEEAARLLEAAGYKIEKPKTEAEILREQMATMQADQKRLQEEHAKSLEEMKALIVQGQQQATPQRRSQVLGANIGEPATNRYQPLHGRHLQEQINKLDWSSLADRTAPLPESVPLDLLMREMEQYYAVLYDNRYGILTAVS